MISAIPSAMAACNFIRGFSSDFGKASFPGVISVPSDLPVGGVIATAVAPATGKPWFECTRASGSQSDYGYMREQLENAAFGFYADDVINTNLPGVGIKISSPFSPTGEWVSRDRKTFYFDGPKTYNNDYPINYTLIKTGDIKGGQVALNSGFVRIIDDGNPIGFALTASPLTTTIVKSSCSVSAKNLVIPLGNVQADSFGGTTGTLAGAAGSGTLSLNCTQMPDLKIKLDGNNSTGMKGVIDLDNKDSAGVADGVGVVFSNDETGPLPVGSFFSYPATSLNTDFTIKAQYIQTKSRVKPGTANATATLTFTYE